MLVLCNNSATHDNYVYRWNNDTSCHDNHYYSNGNCWNNDHDPTVYSTRNQPRISKL
jgi:hypothetical protein